MRDSDQTEEIPSMTFKMSLWTVYRWLNNQIIVLKTPLLKDKEQRL